MNSFNGASLEDQIDQWRQFLRRKQMLIGSNLFHLGILALLGGHFVGLLTPINVFDTLGDEAVILNFENGIYYGLNPVSARIVELIAEPRTVSAILAILLDEYDVDADRCRQDLVNLLAKLKEHDLIETE